MDNMIGQRIKERRRALKITQTQIQENTSISSGNLSCIENGKYLPSATALVELSNILECSVDWILTGNSSISNNQVTLDIKDSERTLLTQFKELSEDDQEEILMMVQLKYNRTQKAREKEQKSSPSGSGTATDEIA